MQETEQQFLQPTVQPHGSSLQKLMSDRFVRIWCNKLEVTWLCNPKITERTHWNATLLGWSECSHPGPLANDVLHWIPWQLPWWHKLLRQAGECCGKWILPVDINGRMQFHQSSSGSQLLHPSQDCDLHVERRGCSRRGQICTFYASVVKHKSLHKWLWGFC